MTTTTTLAPVDLHSADRSTELNPRQIRAKGWVPATLYGPTVSQPVSLEIEAHEFLRKYHSEKHRVFKLTGVTGQPVVRVKQIQVHSVKRHMLNIEFMPA
jgi:ribosomal protein L25 (general stress protein Ctc)